MVNGITPSAHNRYMYHLYIYSPLSGFLHGGNHVLRSIRGLSNVDVTNRGDALTTAQKPSESLQPDEHALNDAPMSAGKFLQVNSSSCNAGMMSCSRFAFRG